MTCWHLRRSPLKSILLLSLIFNIKMIRLSTSSLNRSQTETRFIESPVTLLNIPSAILMLLSPILIQTELLDHFSLNLSLKRLNTIIKFIDSHLDAIYKDFPPENLVIVCSRKSKLYSIIRARNVKTTFLSPLGIRSNREREQINRLFQ